MSYFKATLKRGDFEKKVEVSNFKLNFFLKELKFVFSFTKFRALLKMSNPSPASRERASRASLRRRRDYSSSSEEGQRSRSKCWRRRSRSREGPRPEPGARGGPGGRRRSPQASGHAGAGPSRVRETPAGPERAPSRASRASYASSVAGLERRFEYLSNQLVSQLNDILDQKLQSRVVYSTALDVPESAFSAEPAPELEQEPAPEHAAGAPPAPRALPALPVHVVPVDHEARVTVSAQVLQNRSCITDLTVSVKEPVVPKAKPDRVAKIDALSRFDCPEWKAVRYVEAQKKYLASPAFSEVRTNAELRRLEGAAEARSSRAALQERSFAALSNAVIAQNEAVNTALEDLMNWCALPDSDKTPDALYNKLKERFDNDSDYKVISHDILQIVSGKRAEALADRRFYLLKSLKDKYIKEDLEKIPPTSEYMFNPEALAAYLQKIGGLDKIQKHVPQAQPRRRSPGPAASYRDKPFSFRPRSNKKPNKKGVDSKQDRDTSSKKKGISGKNNQKREPRYRK